MRVRTALLALTCAAWGGAASEQGTEQATGHSETREKRQTLLNSGAGSGCADWALLNYLLYYYLIQAQSTDSAQVQHQQSDQMAAALLKLRRLRATDPLPTLLSQPAGQAAILTLLQKVTQGDTGQLLLLLSDIRDHGRMAMLSPAQSLRPGPGRTRPGLGSLGQQGPLGQQGQQGPLGQQGSAFGPAPPQQSLRQQFPGQGGQQLGSQQFGPLAGAGQPGLTGRQASGLRGLFGPSAAAGESPGFQAGPQAQAQTTVPLSQAANRPQSAVPKPPPTAAPTAPPTTRPSTTPRTPPPPTQPRTTRRPKPRTSPKPRLPLPPPRAPPRPTPAAVRSRILAPSTSFHVTTSTLVTTILLRKTKTVPAVRGDTPTSVQHVHTVTHVLTATGLQTSTVVVTPTLVISAGTTRTVFGGAAAPGGVAARSGRRRRRRRGAAELTSLQPSAPIQQGRVVRGAVLGSSRTPELPPSAS